MNTNHRDNRAPDTEREVNGQFRPGNKGGPGNPFAAKMASLRKVLMDSVTEEDIQIIANVLKLKAKTGDKAAVKLLF